MTGYFTTLRTILVKDARLLWPLVLLCALLPPALALLSGSPAVQHLLATLSTSTNLILICTVIQTDTPSDHRIDWLIRPVAPALLLMAKVIFLAAALLLPSIAGDLLTGVIAGATFDGILPATATTHFMSLAMALPIMAAAALTTRLVETAVVGLLVAVPNALVLPAILALPGPPPDLTAEQIFRLALPILVSVGMAGSVLTLWLQYMRRRGRAARLVFATTALLTVLVQAGAALTL